MSDLFEEPTPQPRRRRKDRPPPPAAFKFGPFPEIVPPPGYKPNLGFCPAAARGKRVRVILRNGDIPADVEGPFPPGWAADGRGGASWRLRDDFPFDILFYLVIE